MKTMKVLATAIAALALAACSSSSSSTPSQPPYEGFVRPAGTIAVNFTVDDTANKVYAPGDLKWKGSMIYDASTRIITPDSTWSGVAPGGGALSGWAPLMDDGPWTANSAAHEPSGNVADDHKLGVTVFVTPPVSGTQTYEYGLIDATYETAYGNGWIWPAPNGTFTVNAGQTTDINAPGLVIPAFGDRDLRLQIDTSAIDASVTWVTSTVKVKGSAWAWGNVDITGSKAGTVYTFTLSDVIGAGKPFDHTGLLHAGNTPEFIFSFDAAMTGSTTTSCCSDAALCSLQPPCEYKVAGVGAHTGVTASTRIGTSGAFADQPISVNANNNPYVTVP